MDRNNITIPPQIILASTTNSTSNNSTTTDNTTTPKKSTNSAAIGAGVAVPLVLIAAIAGFLFWYMKRKKTRREQGNELDTSGSWQGQELDGQRDAKEMHAGEAGKEMHGDYIQMHQLDAKEKPVELDGGRHVLPPVELE